MRKNEHCPVLSNRAASNEQYVILIALVLIEDDSSPSPSFKHSVLTAVMTQKYSEKLFITPADAALGLCT